MRCELLQEFGVFLRGNDFICTVTAEYSADFNSVDEQRLQQLASCKISGRGVSVETCASS